MRIIFIFLFPVAAFKNFANHRLRYSCSLLAVPDDVYFEPNQIEIMRFLGKVDVVVDKSSLDDMISGLDNADGTLNELRYNVGGRTTYVRIFEGKLLNGTKCFIKEYFPIGLAYGKKELSVTRKLRSNWNSIFSNMKLDSDEDIERLSNEPPFPILLGYLRTDSKISDPAFRKKWSLKFPRIKPPEADNLWLVFKFDEYSFKSIKLFPPLPQVIEGLDYFRKDQRINKRWLFIRTMIRRCLESLDYIHSNGYCHNAIR